MLLFALLLTFIGIAVGLAWFLIGHDHGEKEPIAMLWLALGFGLAGAIAASLIENWLIPSNNLAAGTAYGTLLPSTLAVGVIEEGFKFLPLAVMIYKRPYFNEHTDGVIYFALAGLGFGLPENILYTLQFGAKTAAVRLLLTPFFHAAITGLLGYYLVKRKLAGKSPWTAGLLLAVMMVLHGLYDFGLTSGSTLFAAGSLLITLGITAGLFVAFLHAQEHDQDLGLSAVGRNAFCRSCGYPNPQHHLYCTHCGKNA